MGRRAGRGQGCWNAIRRSVGAFCSRRRNHLWRKPTPNSVEQGRFREFIGPPGSTRVSIGVPGGSTDRALKALGPGCTAWMRAKAAIRLAQALFPPGQLRSHLCGVPEQSREDWAGRS